MTKMSKDDLIMLGDLVQTGKVKPVIERTCKLSDAPRLSAFSIKDTLAEKS